MREAGITTRGMTGMSTTTTEPPRMTADQFIAWAMRHPRGKRYELSNGRAVAMAPERWSHATMKGEIARLLGNAIKANGLPGTIAAQGMTIRLNDWVFEPDVLVFRGEMNVDVGNNTIFKPDVVMRRGERLPRPATKLLDPLIVVEVLSPSKRPLHQERKLEAYLAIPTLQHYLVVNAETRRIHHYRRRESGAFLTTIHGHEPITLGPPGITIDRLFA